MFTASLALTCLSLAPAAEPVPLVAEVGEPPLPPGATARLGSPRFRGGGVQQLRYSPDGKLLLAGTHNGVFLWEAATGKRLLAVRDREHVRPAALGFGPAGELVIARYPNVAGYTPGQLVRLDRTTGKVLSAVLPKDNRRYQALSPDGKRLVSVAGHMNSSDAEVVVEDPAAGKELWRRRIPHVTFAWMLDDGSRVAAWPNGTSNLEVYDAATGKHLDTFTMDRGTAPAWTPYAVAGKPDGTLIAMHGGYGDFTVFKPGAAKPTATGRSLSRAIDAAFTSDGKRVVFVSHEGFDVWDAAAWKRVARYEVQGIAGQQPVVISPDGKTLATGGYHNTVQLWDLATGKPQPQSPDPAGDATAVWFDSAGRLITHFSIAGRIAWDVKTGTPTPLTDRPPGTRHGVWSADRSFFASATDGRLTVYDPAGKPLRTCAADKPVQYPQFSPDGKHVIGHGKAGVAAWDRTTGAGFFVSYDDPEKNRHATTADGKHLVVFTQKWMPVVTHVTFRDLATGKVVREFDTDAWLSAPSFSPDGKLFLAYRTDPDETDDIPGDNWLGLYDATTGKRVRKLTPQGESHLGLSAFTADGKRYAVTTSDGQWVLHDTATGAEVRRLRTGPIFAFAISADGKTLATTSADAPILLWDIGGK
jgi:WD40 repeat protein